MGVIQNGTNVGCRLVDHPGYLVLAKELSAVKRVLFRYAEYLLVFSFCIMCLKRGEYLL